MAINIQSRRGTAASATANNTVLLSGELGVETDTGKFKIGDGTTAWNDLAYATAAANLTGTLPVASGGTGIATLAAGYVPVGNGTSAFSAVQATDANTASTIVQRDASGNFSAGTIALEGAIQNTSQWLTISNGLNSDIAIVSGNVTLNGQTSDASIGGFSFNSGTQADGQLLFVTRHVDLLTTIVNEDASSTAANRILTLAGANVALGLSKSMMVFVYSSYLQRWLLLGTSNRNPLSLGGGSQVTLATGTNNDVVLVDGNLQFTVGSGAGPFTITGIAGGVDGREIMLLKGFWQDLSFTSDDTSSAAGNRIQCPLRTTLTLSGNEYYQTITLVWTGALGAWVVKSHT